MANQRLTPSPAVRASVSGDGLVLLDVDGGLVLSSNAIGARVWQLLEAQRTPAQIVCQLVSEYEVPPERAGTDVAAFIADLLARGLVVESAA